VKHPVYSKIWGNLGITDKNRSKSAEEKWKEIVE
jgi:hypothetical protein